MKAFVVWSGVERIAVFFTWKIASDYIDRCVDEIEKATGYHTVSDFTIEETNLFGE